MTALTTEDTEDAEGCSHRVTESLSQRKGLRRRRDAAPIRRSSTLETQSHNKCLGALHFQVESDVDPACMTGRATKARQSLGIAVVNSVTQWLCGQLSLRSF
jgi:hypothetical protein